MGRISDKNFKEKGITWHIQWITVMKGQGG